MTTTSSDETPGVYISEPDAFPPSVVGVATAVPIFVGYTETARDPQSGTQGAPMYLKAVPIASMGDYLSYFGAAYEAKGIVEPCLPADADFEALSSSGAASAVKGFRVGTSTTLAHEVTFTAQFNLFPAIELFYANGGGNCIVVSVANYWGARTVTPTPDADPVAVGGADLIAGLAVAEATIGATMVVVPDACLLAAATTQDGVTTYDYSEYAKVVVQMLSQAGQLRDRMAILDMPGALIPANWTPAAMLDEAQAFYAAIAPAAPYFSYGAAYGPAVESSLLSKADVSFVNLSGGAGSTAWMNNLLTTQALVLYPPSEDASGGTHYPDIFVDVAAHIAAAFPVDGAVAIPSTPPAVTGTTALHGTPAATLQVALKNEAICKPPTDAPGIAALDQYLLNATPLLGDVQLILAGALNATPPSGIMAGVWTQTDETRGVWNAPANIALNEVIAPKVVLDDDAQGDFDMPLNGNAIDILRAMVNRGTVVWGARTLDGNSLDYRYIQVRRTLIYIEQSIKLALEQFVFAPNDGATWTTVIATVSNFLTHLWQAGGLMGDKASDAFTVACGVPTTMTGLDVLNGTMIVNVTVQMIHPGEFIELTFSQAMQDV